MCGIAGCFGGQDIETVNRMLDALPHREPNDRCIHAQNGNVLVHTRLSIVDVVGGHQPILTNDGKTGISCNGEIYNYMDLREKQVSKYQFATKSDTEVILHLYQDKGSRMCQRTGWNVRFPLRSMCIC